MCLTSKLVFQIIFILIVFTQVSIAGNELGPVKKLFKIDKIVIQGLKKVEKEAILEKIHAKKGLYIDNYLLRDDISRIYNMKYFESVETYRDQQHGLNILIFKVQEKPIIRKISFEGNDEIDSEDLKEQLKVAEFSILDINSLKTDIASLQKHYEEKGYYLASVDYDLRKKTNETVEVVFVVKEFEKVRIKKITYLGNIAFTDQELKEIMFTKEESLFSFMSGSGNFKEFNFQTDVERVKYFYKTKGYLQVNVGTPEITVSEDKRWMFISMKITEGPMFLVNNIHFDGEILFTKDELFEKVSIKKEDVYSEAKLQKDIQLLTELYQDEGYAFANVLRTLKIVPGENKVDIHFSFEKGQIAYIGKIIVKGNTKTRDKVVRRELKIREGMKYSGTLLRRSKENVVRLGFFENSSVVFNTVTHPGRDDIINLEISVKERNTGQIMLGAGFSTATKFFLKAQIAQRNFRGLGQILDFQLDLSESSKRIRLGFTEPYLFDSKWSAGGDVFKDRNSNESYKINQEGFDLRVGYPIFEFTRMFLTYKLENTDMSDHVDVTIDETLENGISSSLVVTLENDTRNNRFEPSKGHYFRLSNAYTGVGWDEKKWIKSEFIAQYYKRLYGEFVFRSRLRMGKIIKNGRPIPRSEKLVMGGQNDLRGYHRTNIGPQRAAIVDDVKRTFALGGLGSFLSTMEVEHPLVHEAGLKWALFFDAGNIFENHFGNNGIYDLRMDWGFGLRWYSPIGLLRFEMAYPIARRPGEAGHKFNFDIGQSF